MTRRVLVLAHPCPSTWTDYYIEALRETCDARVMGPEATAAQLADLGRAGLKAIRPDFPVDFEQSFDLVRELDGWTPDLVLGIAGVGGMPLYRGIAELPWPTAYLTVDTWQSLLDYRQAMQYDVVFAAQREFVTHLRATGCRHAQWLPLAASPAHHHPADVEETHDIAFAGSLHLDVHANRRELLDTLRPDFSVLAENGCFGEQLCELYCRGRLAFNHSAVQEVNMRIFEAMAMGRPLVTSAEAESNGLLELFEEGRDLLLYDSAASLHRVCQQSLSTGERERMGKRARDRILEAHTYAHRISTLLEAVDRLLPPHAPLPREHAAPQVVDWLPRAPGRILDVGMALGVSRIAMRQRGAEEFAGIAWTPEALRQRGGRYDETALWPAEPRGDFDTVAIGGEPLPMDYEHALAWAHASLAPGGTLLLAAHAEPLEAAGMGLSANAIEAWLQRYDFLLRRAGGPLPDGTLVIQARKRTRRVREVVAEVHRRLALDYADVPALLERIPSGW
ncbi:MAG: glycosyltransferase [Candidatus Hydrogenedens sp.]|nr:glycosyltransferase [Candidatus Hydrogenedens sp.]